MVSRKVLIGAGMAVLVVAAAYFLLVPSEMAEMEKLNAILAKYGVDFPDNFSYSALSALPSSQLSALKSELQAFRGAPSFIFPKPENVANFADFLARYAEAAQFLALLEKKNDDVLAKFLSPPCDSITAISERNDLEAMVLEAMENLDASSGAFGLAAGARPISELEAEHAVHIKALKDLKEGCGA